MPTNRSDEIDQIRTRRHQAIDRVLQEVRDELRALPYGEVHITVNDHKVVQVDVLKKRRLV